MQAELLEVLDEDAALGLDDGLRQAGGARGVEHPQRVVEGDLLEDGFGVRTGQGRAQEMTARIGLRGAWRAAELRRAPFTRIVRRTNVCVR